jgi:hypothetical protein
MVWERLPPEERQPTRAAITPMTTRTTTPTPMPMPSCALEVPAALAELLEAAWASDAVVGVSVRVYAEPRVGEGAVVGEAGEGARVGTAEDGEAVNNNADAEEPSFGADVLVPVEADGAAVTTLILLVGANEGTGVESAEGCVVGIAVCTVSGTGAPA